MFKMGLWTKMHVVTVIPTFIIMAICAALVGCLMKNRSDKAKYKVLGIIAILLLVLEVIKQILSFEDGEYNTYSLPFHYCSLFLYLLPLHSLYHGKHKNVIDVACFGTLASLFFFMLVMPNIVYSDAAIMDFMGSYSSFHTVTFHMLVVFYFFLTVAFGFYSFDTKRDLKIMAVFLAIYVIIATVLSHTLKVNFHNLYKCNVSFVEDIRLAMIEKIGWVAQAIYVSALFVLTILFAYAAYFTVKFLISLVKRKRI